tara:strand:- start:1228 stop:2040 length:813 start_codon:yes stop_codon:yes gene_type:complete
MKLSPHRETNFHFETAIIGSSLEALITAFKYQIPILGIPDNKPLPHYYLPSDLDLSPIQCNNEPNEFTYLSGNKEVRGMQALELWDIMFYRLSLMGLAPFWGAKSSIMNEGIPESENIRMLSLYHNNKVVNATFDKAIFFDYPRYADGKRIFLVNDYININTIFNTHCDIFQSKDCDFLQTLAYETVFYKRTAKLHGCCVKSIIVEENIDNWENSQTSIRMRVEKDIFWNIDKAIKLTISHRQKAPMLVKMSESVEEIIHFNVMDQEVYD